MSKTDAYQTLNGFELISEGQPNINTRYDLCPPAVRTKWNSNHQPPVNLLEMTAINPSKSTIYTLL